MANHLLLFDIDGTLVHAAGAGRLALTRALTTEFGIAEPLLEVEFAGRTDRAIASEALARNGLEPRENFARYLEAYLMHLPAALEERRGRVLDGVRELLPVLTARTDAVLGILTGNVERAARMKLAHFELDAFFEGGGCGGFGDHHHERDEVARAAERAFVTHAKEAVVWVVGDTPADVRCARAIGARAIAVAAGFTSYEELRASHPDHLLRDLCRPEDFLTLLDGASDCS